MNPVATRIYEKIKSLEREKEALHNRIKSLTQTADAEKKAIHHTELNLLSESIALGASGLPDFRLANKLRELNKEKHDLQSEEGELQHLTAQYKELLKTIDQHQFWMHRADSTDPARQHEAEKKIFG